MMTVADHLFLDIMLKVGLPRILHSDNGLEFKSKLIENLSHQLCIKKAYISLTTQKLMEKWNLHIDLSRTLFKNFL